MRPTTASRPISKPSRTRSVCQARIEFWGEGIPFWYKKRLALGIDLANSNCKEDSYRFVVDGRAPWWNCQIPRTEWSSNPALIGMNNPDPSDTVENVIE